MAKSKHHFWSANILAKAQFPLRHFLQIRQSNTWPAKNGFTIYKVVFHKQVVIDNVMLISSPIDFPNYRRIIDLHTYEEVELQHECSCMKLQHTYTIPQTLDIVLDPLILQHTYTIPQTLDIVLDPLIFWKPCIHRTILQTTITELPVIMQWLPSEKLMKNPAICVELYCTHSSDDT